jgi:hypothetical protein
MPDEAPDRVLDAALDQIDFTPQARRPWLADPWRFPEMPRFVLAGAAVVVALALGAIALAPRSSPSVGASPTPSALLSARASQPPGSATSAAAASVPTALQHRWMGAPNALTATGAGSSISLAASTFALSQSNENDQPALTAAAGVVAPGQLRLTTAGSQGRCPADAAGVYDWVLSSSGRVLTIRAGNDPCTARSGAIVGTWWLSSCKDPSDNCLGPLDAGTYASQFINFGAPTAGWQPRFGAVTYTVPAGWANDSDWPAFIGFAPQADYDRWVVGQGTPRELELVADARAVETAKPCTAAPAFPRGPAAILAAMKDVPGLVVGASGEITVGGHAASWVDLSVDDATLRPCPGGERIVEYLVTASGGEALAVGERARLILLSADAGTIGIVVRAPAADFEALVTSAMPIVASMQFK